jgi:hypothetical protein
MQLQESLEIKLLEPNKVGLRFKAGNELSDWDKALLRGCIKTVYGKNISMVKLNDAEVVETVKTPEDKAIPEVAIKLKMPTAEESNQRGAEGSNAATSTAADFKWNQVKNEVASSLYANVADRIKANLDQASIVSLSGKKLRLKASWLVCETFTNHQATIERVAGKHDVDIELENTTDKEILYFPWVYPSKDLPSLTLDNLKK